MLKWPLNMLCKASIARSYSLTIWSKDTNAKNWPLSKKIIAVTQPEKFLIPYNKGI